MVMYNIWGTGVELQVFQESVNPARKGLKFYVDHMELNYDMTLAYIIYVLHP
jgi:hypothetical protein